jgi:hypothetical protein
MAAVLVLLVAVLLAWQSYRERLLGDCNAAGGIWDGARSRCIPAPPIIIQRDLQRS